MAENDPLIDDGLLVLDSSTSRIVDVGPFRAVKRTFHGEITDLGPATLTPGVINAHTHLELSHLQGRTVLGQGFDAWVRSLLALPMNDVRRDDFKTPIAQLRGCETAHVADLTSRHPDLVLQILEQEEIGFTLFVEFFGFPKKDPSRLIWPPKTPGRKKANRICAAGHALYSTHPQILQLAKSWDSRNNLPFNIHLAEHTGEIEFLATGRGGFADLLKNRLVPDTYVPPGVSPVVYADQLGLLDDCTLAVHCVHLTGDDIDILARTETNVCLCPRSNAGLGVGRAPWEAMMHRSIPLCLGTDSLASTSDLDLWKEAEFLLRDAQTGVSQHRIVSMLTRNPARALGLEKDLGSIEPGKL
ncbi:MAG: amidohydrolase family protein, partial [Desulfovibrionales bacterium]